MVRAFALAIGQLNDPAIRRVLIKSLLITLALFAVLGAAGWWALDRGLMAGGFDEQRLGVPHGLRGLVALLAVILGGWLLWRVIALAVMQFYADDVVRAVEARYYPAAAAQARTLPWREELGQALRAAGRAIVLNLIALPVALVLLVTGIGAALVFWLVNAVLLGRELHDMVWLRHRHTRSDPPPLNGLERLMLGGAVAALLTVPFVNLLAPILGAAAATHLVHRKGAADAH